MWVALREGHVVATLTDGRPVGFAPGRNHYNPMISSVAVLPEHRGNGYITTLLSSRPRESRPCGAFDAI